MVYIYPLIAFFRWSLILFIAFDQNDIILIEVNLETVSLIFLIPILTDNFRAYLLYCYDSLILRTLKSLRNQNSVRWGKANKIIHSNLIKYSMPFFGSCIEHLSSIYAILYKNIPN